MLPLSVDYGILVVVVLAAVGLTLWARRGDARAAKWGRILSRFCYGPAVYVLLFDPVFRLWGLISSLDVDVHAAPNAPLSTAANSVAAMTDALTAKNWLPLILTIGVAIYAAADIPRMAAERQGEREGLGNAANTPREA